MIADTRIHIDRVVSCRVECDVPLATLSTYRIGGPARTVVYPVAVDDVVAVVDAARRAGVPWMAVGLGSNVLFPDAGFDGIVVKIGKGMDRIDVLDGRAWRVGAGLPIPILARRTAAKGLAGVQRLIGVPGAVGGGVFMNAGAHGQDFGSVVRAVSVVGPDAVVREIPGRDVPWTYRSSGLKGVVLAAMVELEPASPAVLKQEVRRYLSHRRAGTPFDQPCCGSVFRNPTVTEPVDGIDGLPTAGRLIEAVGMKGFRIGGAVVSPVHANYIVNAGTATAADVRGVIDAVSQRVALRFGIHLMKEVQVLESGTTGG